MTGADWLNYFMQADQQKKRKNDWLDTAGTALGAGAGFLLGGPAGAMAGSQLGGAVGGLGEAASNKELTPGGVVGAVTQGVGGYGDLAKIAKNRALMDQFMEMARAGMIPQAFSNGGIAGMPDPRALLELLSGARQPDPLGGLTPEQFAGPAPPVPQYAQAKHPGWEAAASVLGDVLSNLPAPRPTRSSNKTIGAYMPAVGAGLSGIANRAAAGREAVNKPMREQYAQESNDYRTRVTNAGRELAIWRRMKGLQDAKPQGAAPVGSQMYDVTPEEARALKRPDWAGKQVPLASVEQARKMNAPPPSAITGVTYDKKVAQAKEIARRVRLGLTDPNMAGFRDMKPYVEAQLGDFNTSQAAMAFEATKTFIKQRESRLTQQQRNSMRAVQKQFGLLDQFNEQYSDAAKSLRTSMHLPNASVLWMAENGLLGKPAELRSRNLKGQLVLMRDQIANIFMAGGVPTDQALKMTQDVFDATWSEDQITSNSAMVKADIAGRLAALNEARPLVEPTYMPPGAKSDSSKVEFNW